MKRLTIAIVAFGLAAFSAGAQDSDRAAQMRRVVEGLNSADPVTRVITFEDAMGTKDRNIQRIALQTAFASSDLALRSAAMEGVMANKSALVIKINSYSTERGREFVESNGPYIDMSITNFDPQTGNFLVHSSLSNLHRVEGSRTVQPRKKMANFSGDRLSFALNTGTNNDGIDCSGAVTLGDAGSILTGTMSCPRSRSGAYGIEIDLLR